MQRKAIEELLPTVFRQVMAQGEPLYALVGVMEMLHAPAEEALDRLDRHLDPYASPEHFLAFLASWVDMDRFFGEQDQDPTPDAPPSFPTGLGRLRELIAAAAYLSKWRGTAQGLLLFLRTATGLDSFDLDEQVPGVDGRPRPFHIAIKAPHEAAPYRALVERIIEMEKPAYVTYELRFGAP